MSSAAGGGLLCLLLCCWSVAAEPGSEAAGLKIRLSKSGLEYKGQVAASRLNGSSLVDMVSKYGMVDYRAENMKVGSCSRPHCGAGWMLDAIATDAVASVAVFKSSLKTFLFSQAFSSFSAH